MGKKEIDIARLGILEKTIEKGIQTFVDVGAALSEIRDSKLYRASHGTFNDYCGERWGWTPRYAYQICQSADAARRIETECKDGKSLGTKVPIPQSETHARPLTRLPEEQQIPAWKEAVDTAPKDSNGKPKITAAHVQQVVAKRVDPTPAPPGQTPEPPPVEPWKSYNESLSIACELLERAKALILGLPDAGEKDALFAAWMDKKQQKAFFDNAIITYQKQSITGFASESEARKLPNGRNFHYAHEAAKRGKR